MKSPERLAEHQDLDLQFLEVALARLDIRLRREVVRWQLAGQDPADSFRGLYVSDQEAHALLERRLGVSWGDLSLLESERENDFTSALDAADHRMQDLRQALANAGQSSRLDRLAQAFELDPFDLDVLMVGLAPSLDLRYGRVFGYLQDDVTRKRPSVDLTLKLIREPGPMRLAALSHFGARSPLMRYELLLLSAENGEAPLLSQSLMIEESVVAWLLGNYRPHQALEGKATLARPSTQILDALRSGELDEILATLDKAPMIISSGPDEAAQHAMARQIAIRLDRPLLSVDMAVLVQEGIDPGRATRLALRDARLTGAVPLLFGWQSCLTDNGGLAPPPDALEELVGFESVVVLAGSKGWHPGGIDRRRPALRIDFPIPNYGRRLALWQHHLNDEGQGLDLPALAGQFTLPSGKIRDVVASARDRAQQRAQTLADQDLFSAAREHSSPRLAGLARKIEVRYDWDDIVLPADQRLIMREIVGTVRGRPQVLEAWGVGDKLASSAGVTVLFAGPPGTGKTMAAEIIAGELSLDLFKIDLSTVISKYIGETEKNLERIFDEAASSNAILFFDEADALFGKRSEVRDSHDRYANIEISYLLQRMEAYDGVTILATNLRANLDEAFTRRLQFAVDFPFPEEEDRLRIWKALFPPGVPRAENLDLESLARRFKLAGGNIRNVLVSAAYLAAADGGRVTMEHLIHGTRRELQKMGRLIGEEDLLL